MEAVILVTVAVIIPRIQNIYDNYRKKIINTIILSRCTRRRYRIQMIKIVVVKKKVTMQAINLVEAIVRRVIRKQVDVVNN